MSKWEGILGRIFRGAFRRGAARGLSAAAPKLTRVGGEVLAGHVARSTLRIFKNNLLALPWIRQGEELDASAHGARADLLRSWNVYRDGLRSQRTDARAQADGRPALAALRPPAPRAAPARPPPTARAPPRPPPAARRGARRGRLAPGPRGLPPPGFRP